MELENGIDNQLVVCSVSTVGISHWHEERDVIKKWCALLPGIVITYRNLVMR